MVNAFKTLISPESLESPYLLYAASKLVFPLSKDDNKVKIAIYWSARSVFTIGTTLTMFLALFLFAIYFELVKYVARIYFGENYSGILNGPDSHWTDESPNSRSIVHILGLFDDVQNTERTPELLMQFFKSKKAHETLLELHPRYASLRKSFMGYSHLVKLKNLDLQQVVSYLDNYDTYDEFQDVVNHQSYKDLPYNGEFSWEICIGQQKVCFPDGRMYYPWLYRIHHSVTDGISMISVIIASYSKNGMETLRERCNHYTKHFNLTPKPRKHLCLTHNFIRHSEADNALHCDLSQEKLVSYSFESEDSQLMMKIKEIKKVLPSVTFTEIVLSAITASLTRYFYSQKDIKKHPSEIICGNVSYLNSLKFEDLCNEINGNAAVILGNKFLFSYIMLPINPDYLLNPRELIRKIHESSCKIKTSLDFALSRWILHVPSVIIPNVFSGPFKKFFDSTVSFTNIPEINPMEFLNGCKLSNIFLWTNHWKRAGTVFSLFVFNKQLRLTLHLDKNYLVNKKEIHIMSDDVLKYIDLFYHTICAVK